MLERHRNRWAKKGFGVKSLRVVSCFPNAVSGKEAVILFGPSAVAADLEQEVLATAEPSPEVRQRVAAQPKFRRHSDRSPAEHRAEISRLEGLLAKRARRREDRRTGNDRWFV